MKILVGKTPLNVELAITPEEKTLGLMYRKSLSKDNGMLFVYAQPGNHGIWMKNTVIPLSVIFVDEDNNISKIAEGKPLCEDSIMANVPIKYVIETNKGFCDENDIKEGDKIEFKDLKDELFGIAEQLDNYGFIREASDIDGILISKFASRYDEEFYTGQDYRGIPEGKGRGSHAEWTQTERQTARTNPHAVMVDIADLLKAEQYPKEVANFYQHLAGAGWGAAQNDYNKVLQIIKIAWDLLSKPDEKGNRLVDDYKLAPKFKEWMEQIGFFIYNEFKIDFTDDVSSIVDNNFLSNWIAKRNQIIDRNIFSLEDEGKKEEQMKKNIEKREKFKINISPYELNKKLKYYIDNSDQISQGVKNKVTKYLRLGFDPLPHLIDDIELAHQQMEETLSIGVTPDNTASGGVSGGPAGGLRHETRPGTSALPNLMTVVDRIKNADEFKPMSTEENKIKRMKEMKVIPEHLRAKDDDEALQMIVYRSMLGESPMQEAVDLMRSKNADNYEEAIGKIFYDKKEERNKEHKKEKRKIERERKELISKPEERFVRQAPWGALPSGTYYDQITGELVTEKEIEVKEK